jgi:hypothetical protein
MVTAQTKNETLRAKDTTFGGITLKNALKFRSENSLK